MEVVMEADDIRGVETTSIPASTEVGPQPLQLGFFVSLVSSDVDICVSMSFKCK